MIFVRLVCSRPGRAGQTRRTAGSRRPHPMPRPRFHWPISWMAPLSFGPSGGVSSLLSGGAPPGIRTQNLRIKRGLTTVRRVRSCPLSSAHSPSRRAVLSAEFAPVVPSSLDGILDGAKASAAAKRALRRRGGIRWCSRRRRRGRGRRGHIEAGRRSQATGPRRWRGGCQGRSTSSDARSGSEGVPAGATGSPDGGAPGRRRSGRPPRRAR